MLRPNGNSGKIREGNFVSLPHRSIRSTKARRSKGYVFAMSAGCSGRANASRQEQSGLETLRCRCANCALAVLGALSGFNQVCNKAPARNITSVNCRGRCNAWGLGKKQKDTGVVWTTTLRFLAATGTTARTPVRAARTGTTLPRTRTTTSGRALSVTMQITRSANATAWQAGHSTCGQPILSRFGEYISGFGITPSRKSKSAADFL